MYVCDVSKDKLFQYTEPLPYTDEEVKETCEQLEQVLTPFIEDPVVKRLEELCVWFDENGDHHIEDVEKLEDQMPLTQRDKAYRLRERLNLLEIIEKRGYKQGEAINYKSKSQL